MLIGGYAAVALALLLPTPAAAVENPCDRVFFYTANSTLERNLNLLIMGLAANASASPAGYASGTVGVAQDQVYGLALCRGDTNVSSCAACVPAAFQDAKRVCPMDTGVFIFRDDCALRFAKSRFLDALKPEQWIPSELFIAAKGSTKSVDAPEAWFSAAVTRLVAALADSAAAASNTTRKYFAMGEMDFAPKLYGLAQCMPDLTPSQCRDCIAYLRIEVAQALQGDRPSWFSPYAVWCSLMYSVSKFYNGRAMLQLSAPPEPPPAATAPTPKSAAGRKRMAAEISAGVACSVVLMLILSVLTFLRFRRRNKATENDHPLKTAGRRAQCTIFDLQTLQQATEHFSEKNKLGEGGFGTVYKGTLSDGQEIAVKTLSGRTGHALHQLRNEVLVLAELQHKNLVRLEGFCSRQSDTLLVYEYIKNGSLDSFLFDSKSRNAFSWEQQYNIILGIAKGILYLHEDSSVRIIHRDLKANNILLDDDMEPKIADFGLARLLGDGHTQTLTTRAVGTLGYMAPEYAMNGRVSPKIDIFSFGVLVLEIVTRRSNCSSAENSNLNLLSDVWDNWTKGTILQMLHQPLDEHSQSRAIRCIHVGLLCVQPDPDDRPDISAVVFMLTRDNMELQPPTQPAFFFGGESPSASRSDGQSSYVYDRSGSVLEQSISVNRVTLTEPYPR